jgi:hypothetical protein
MHENEKNLDTLLFVERLLTIALSSLYACQGDWRNVYVVNKETTMSSIKILFRLIVQRKISKS